MKKINSISNQKKAYSNSRQKIAAPSYVDLQAKKNITKHRLFYYIIPLIILVLIFTVGIFAIYKIEDRKKLEQSFEKEEIVNLPQISFQNLFNDNDFVTNLDFTKSEYSLLNVFASWCVSCVVENEVLLKISQNKNINIYGIAFRDIDENTKKYLEKNKNPYKKVGIDRKGELSKLLLVEAIPETFVINKKNQIIYRYQGAVNKEFIEFLNKLPIAK